MVTDNKIVCCIILRVLYQYLANLFLKQGISSEYVMVDFICMGKLGLQGSKTENYKMKKSCP